MVLQRRLRSSEGCLWRLIATRPGLHPEAEGVLRSTTRRLPMCRSMSSSPTSRPCTTTRSLCFEVLKNRIRCRPFLLENSTSVFCGRRSEEARAPDEEDQGGVKPRLLVTGALSWLAVLPYDEIAEQRRKPKPYLRWSARTPTPPPPLPQTIPPPTTVPLPETLTPQPENLEPARCPRVPPRKSGAVQLSCSVNAKVCAM